LIEEGPVPMGPILYLEAPDRSVGTLICRCMPAQAKAVSRNLEYKLVAWTDAAPFAEIWKQEQRKKMRLGFWPGISIDAGALERALRLPPNF